MTRIERCNKLLEDVGRNPFGEPLYKWVFLPTLRHLRYKVGKDDWKLHTCGAKDDGSLIQIWVPQPNFEEVPAFPHLGPRWALCYWQYMDPMTFHRQFGSHVIWPPQGYYFPTNKIMKPGFVPNLDVTEYFIQCIRYSRGKSLADLEQEFTDDVEREEKAYFNRIHDQILDACTAFGNDPGKRSGGVSFPSVTKKESNVIYNSTDSGNGHGNADLRVPQTT